MTDGMTLFIAAAFAALVLSLSGCSGWTAKEDAHRVAMRRLGLQAVVR